MQMLCARLIKAAPPPSTRRCRRKIKLCLKSIERERKRNEGRQKWKSTDTITMKRTACAHPPGNEEPEGVKRFADVDWMESMARKLGVGHLF